MQRRSVVVADFDDDMLTVNGFDRIESWGVSFSKGLGKHALKDGR